MIAAGGEVKIWVYNPKFGAAKKEILALVNLYLPTWAISQVWIRSQGADLSAAGGSASLTLIRVPAATDDSRLAPFKALPLVRISFAPPHSLK